MHVVIAPDKFKGSLTARQVADRVAAGIAAALDEVGAPEVTVVQVPVADGGDGTVDAALAAGYERVPVRAEGPTGDAVDTAFAVREGIAVVEMADVSGLRLLPPDALAPLTASSYGTGEVVRAALDRGCDTVVLGIGGSASTDGGAGHGPGARCAAARRRRQRAAARRRGAGRPRPGRPGRPPPAPRGDPRGGRQRRRQPAARTDRGRGRLRAAEGGRPAAGRPARRIPGAMGRRRRRRVRSRRTTVPGPPGCRRSRWRGLRRDGRARRGAANRGSD